jgi:hypothetical protein
MDHILKWITTLFFGPVEIYLFDKSHLSWVLLDNYKKQYLKYQKNVFLIYTTIVFLIVCI